jgi:hypothetical protein
MPACLRSHDIVLTVKYLRARVRALSATVAMHTTTIQSQVLIRNLLQEMARHHS